MIELVKFENARAAIAECKDISEVKTLKDKAEMLRSYARSAGESLIIQNQIAEIKLRCERKIGEFSKELPNIQKQSLRVGNSPLSHTGVTGKVETLEAAGIKHYERYEAIATLSNEDFEKHINDVKSENRELTSTRLILFAQSFLRKKNPSPRKLAPAFDAKKVTQLRIQRKISQYNLAMETQVEPATLSRIESGFVSSVTFEVAARLAEFFGIPMETFKTRQLL